MYDSQLPLQRDSLFIKLQKQIGQGLKNAKVHDNILVHDQIEYSCIYTAQGILDGERAQLFGICDHGLSE